MSWFETKQKSAGSSAIETVIGSSTKIKGEVHCASSLRVCGEVEGKISAGEDVYFDEKSMVRGSVAARRVVVGGEINGTVVGVSSIEIEKKGSVHGDLVAERLLIEEGAVYKGKVNINVKSTDAFEKNANFSTLKEAELPSQSAEVFQLFTQSEN
jgi:cytoskeletal protein CcmA (bactofilin family)